MKDIEVRKKELDYLDLRSSGNSEVKFKKDLVGWMKASNKKNEFIILKGMGFRAKLKQKAVRRQWGGKRWERRNEGTQILN